MLIFEDFPMPPTVNSAYSGKEVRHKSDCYKLFESTCYYWCLENQKTIKKIREIFSGQKSIYIFIWVFKFDERKVLNKTKKAKSAISILDTSNRIKVVEDYISELINVNDSVIFDHLPMKRIGKNTVDIYALDLRKDIEDQLLKIRANYDNSLQLILDHLRKWNEDT